MILADNLWGLFEKGGVFMVPLLLLSFVATLIIVERFIYFTARKYRVGSSLEAIKNQITDPESLKKQRNPLQRFAGLFLESAKEGEEHRKNVTEREANRSVRQHEKGLRLLATIGTVSPLVGLLGTVWGMVQAFASIAELGDRVSPSDLAGGIWTGLLTTVAGLIVAIPAIMAARYFEARTDQLNHDLNEVNSHLEEWSK